VRVEFPPDRAYPLSSVQLELGSQPLHRGIGFIGFPMIQNERDRQGYEHANDHDQRDSLAADWMDEMGFMSTPRFPACLVFHRLRLLPRQHAFMGECPRGGNLGACPRAYMDNGQSNAGAIAE
jgi:hypothetical protein